MYSEDMALEELEKFTLGCSLMFEARDAGKPVEFSPPPCIYKIFDEFSLPYHDYSDFSRGYWWIERGGTMDVVRDAYRIRDASLTTCVLHLHGALMPILAKHSI